MEIKFYKRIDLSEFVEYIELKTFSGDIAIQFCICYNASRQKEVSVHASTKRKPRSVTSGVFFRLVVIVVAV